MAVVHITAMVHTMPSQIHSREHTQEREFEALLVELFRRAGWNVQERQPADGQADVIVASGGKKYVIELKRSAEGRRDRLLPLLSQAILQAQAAARNVSDSAIPVAVVAAPHVPDSVASQLKQFALNHAPNVGVGVMDSEGFRIFHGFGLERFNSERSTPSQRGVPVQSESSSYLFSDLNQWMLKVLLGQNIPESLLGVPRGEYRSGRQLAEAAGVSAMSASRLVRQLSSEGFLDERKGLLRLVRMEQLLRRWQGASQRSAREVPVRWIIRGGKDQVLSAVRSYCSWLDAKSSRPQKLRPSRAAGPAPRIAIGLFSAADMLGFGFVHGVAPHIYLEQLSSAALERLGFSIEDSEGQPDAYMRIPENKEAVFRAAVRHEGVVVSDIVQVWLDVSNHPARGAEQADQIWKRVLAPFIQRERR